MLENESALINAARRGSIEAFNTLVLAYQDAVYGVAYRILGESASAADAAQEAFITAYKNLSGYRGGSFRAWLFRIVTNACYDELRRRKRRPALAFDDLAGAESEDGPPLPADQPSPEQAAAQSELALALERCIQRLQPDYRLILILSDIEGLSYQEIAASAGVTLGTVKSRLSRARAGVRTCLEAVRELLPAEFRLKNTDG